MSLVLLELDQLVEFDCLDVVCVHFFFGESQQVVVLDHEDFLVVGNDRLVIILTEFNDFVVALADEEERLLPIKLIRLIHEREKEDVVFVGFVVHLQLNILLHMIMLDSDIVILLIWHVDAFD